MKREVVLVLIVGVLVFLVGCDAAPVLEGAKATIQAAGQEMKATAEAIAVAYQEFQAFVGDQASNFEVRDGQSVEFAAEGKCLKITYHSANLNFKTEELCAREGYTFEGHNYMGQDFYLTTYNSGVSFYITFGKTENGVTTTDFIVVYAKDLVLGECSCPTPTPAPVPPTATPVPPTPEPTLEANCTFGAEYVSDVTVPDGYVVTAEDIARGTLEKTWRVRNSGSCSWLPGSSGPVLGRYEAPVQGEEAVLDYVRETVKPGNEVDFTVVIGLPTGDNTTGTWTGEYRLRSSSGGRFGPKLSVAFVMP